MDFFHFAWKLENPFDGKKAYGGGRGEEGQRKIALSFYLIN